MPTWRDDVECRFASVSKVYSGNVLAVIDVSFVVAPGKCFAIVGPSGGGKTTLLRLAAGLELPTSGSVWHGDRLATKIPPETRSVAMAFQVPALYPHLNAGDNLAFPLRYHPVPATDQAALLGGIARSLELSDLLQRMPHELSGGQRQRVSLGRCLARRPRLLLLDEPLSQMDVSLRAKVREAILRVCRERGTTVLWVTHDPAEAEAVGDRVIEMRDGRLML
ncbi:MAG: hypothetical protein C0467_06555 [Planctomycetaceae bacterium]|nr:hypothetical protein [Planctomycetaceae bacterium]